MNDLSDYRYCHGRVAPEGSNLYYATLFTDEETKRIVLPLLCFEHEIIRILQTCQDPGVARLKLLWWNEEIGRLYKQKAEHPIGRALSHLVSTHKIDIEVLLGHIGNTETLIYPEQPESLESAIQLLINGPGKLWRLTAEINGYSDPGTPETLEKTAAANALTTLLGQSAFHLHQNRILIPGKYLDKTAIQACLDQDTTALRRVFIPLFTELRHYLQGLYSAMPADDRRRYLHALILCRLLAHQCTLNIRRCDTLFHERTATSPLRKLFIAWKTAWKTNYFLH